MMQWGRRNKIFVAIVALALSCLLYFAQSPARINHWAITNITPPQGAKFDTQVVAFGDSLTAGFGASRAERNYVGLLRQQTGWEIINAGVGGDRSAQGLARLQKDVLSRHPRVVIVLLGGNDFLSKVPLATTLNNLEQILRRTQAQGAVTVLVGIQAPIIGGRTGAAMRELAQKTGSIYVPHILRDIFGKSSMMSDQIHPNDAGYARIAERIRTTAAPLLTTATGVLR